MNILPSAEPQISSVPIPEGRVTLAVPVKGEQFQFVISVERSLQLLFWKWDQPRESGDLIPQWSADLIRLAEVEQDLEKNRFNDGKCDPEGRLFAGKSTLNSFVQSLEPTEIKVWLIICVIKLHEQASR